MSLDFIPLNLHLQALLLCKISQSLNCLMGILIKYFCCKFKMFFVSGIILSGALKIVLEAVLNWHVVMAVLIILLALWWKKFTEVLTSLPLTWRVKGASNIAFIILFSCYSCVKAWLKLYSCICMSFPVHATIWFILCIDLNKILMTFVSKPHFCSQLLSNSLLIENTWFNFCRPFLVCTSVCVFLLFRV